MEDGHLVTDECGHWTVRKLLALVGKNHSRMDNNASERVGVSCGQREK